METYATLLGSADLTHCIPTVKSLGKYSDNGPGHCTWIALSSDNPGYDPDASPAKPLKKIIAAYGLGC